MVWINFI